MDLQTTAYLTEGLSVFRGIRGDAALTALRDTAEACRLNDTAGALSGYGAFAEKLFVSGASSFPAYVFDLILYDDNLYTRAAASGGKAELPQEVRAAARKDVDALMRVAELTPQDFTAAFAGLSGYSPEIGETLASFPAGSAKDWNDGRFSAFWEKNGTGVYAHHYAFRFEPDGGVVPVKAVDPIRLSDLKRYEYQRQQVVENTLAFLGGHPYNNVLLYGDRGTGKSSTVKALLNEYAGQKLRMIEIGKSYVSRLDRLIAAVGGLPLKFILFIDDLTFNENDDNFGILKAVLEGSLAVRPKNVAIYATTNRRHLIKETFSAREGNEVHRGDTLDESLSLSDRFGLTVTFMKPGRDEYLEIAASLAEDRGLAVERARLDRGAEQFALENSGRSPRVARQYVDMLEARLKLGLE